MEKCIFPYCNDLINGIGSHIPPDNRGNRPRICHLDISISWIVRSSNRSDGLLHMDRFRPLPCGRWSAVIEGNGDSIRRQLDGVGQLAVEHELH